MTLEDGHWATIASWQQFQRLLNDLVYYESHGVGIIPSNPNIGADGGWDGKFAGTLYGTTGIHMLQAKHKGGSRVAAVRALRREIPGEITKAVAAGAEHLVVATNADLSVEQAENLQALDRKTLLSLTVWSRARLTQHLERHPGLLAEHFHIGQISLLRIPAEHFSQREPSLSDEVFQDEAIEQIVDRVASTGDSLHLIHGVGGTGKSHVLRRVAQRLVEQSNTIVRVVTGCHGATLFDDVSSDLRPAADTRIALLIDDAERSPSSLLAQLAELAHTDRRYVVVATCRSVAVDSCRTIMRVAEHGIPLAVHVVPALTDADLIAFVRKYAPTRCPEVHELTAAIRQFRRIPFLLRLWAEAHECGGLSPEQVANVYGTIVARCVASCKPVLADLVSESKLKRLLGSIAAVTPFTANDQATMQTIAAISAVPEIDVSLAIGKLERGGVLRRIGKNLRFNPDTIGDLLFGQEMSDDGFRQSIIEHCLPLNPSGLIASVAAAGHWGQTATAGHVAAAVLTAWRGEQRSSAWWDAQDRFRLVSQLCLFAHAEALALVRSHLESAGHLYRSGDDTERRNLLGAFRNVETTLQILGRFGHEREAIIGLVIEVAVQFKPDARKPITDLIVHLFRPLRGPVSLIAADLRRLTAMLAASHDNEVVGWMLVVACSEALAARHEDNFMDGRSYHMRSVALNDHPAVRDLRSAAMAAAGTLVRAQRYSEAIDVAEAIGKSNGPYLSENTDDLPLSSVFENERNEFLGLLEGEDLGRWGLADLHSLDHLALRWWSHQQAVDRSVQTLRRIPRTPLYRLFERLATHILIEDFSVVERDAPAEQRWNWLVEHHSERGITRDPADEQAQDSLAALLHMAYPDADSIGAILLTVSDELKKIHMSAWGDTTISRWVALAPAAFHQLAQQPGWGQVEYRMRQAIEATIAKNHPTAFAEVTQAVVDDHGQNADIISRFLSSMLATTAPLEPLTDVLLSIAGHPQARVRAGMLLTCWQNNLSSLPALRKLLVVTCLRSGYDRSLLEPIAWLYEVRGRDDHEPLPPEIWKTIVDGLSREPEIDHHDGHFFASVTKKNPQSYTDLIERRIAQIATRVADDHSDRFKVFPREWGGWVDINVWQESDIESYLAMITRNRSAVENVWYLHDALKIFELHDSIPDVFASALVHDLDSTDLVRSELALELLMHTSAGMSVSLSHVRNTCHWLLRHNKRDRAARWLHSWQYNAVSSVGDDGVSSVLLGTITMLADLWNQETDVVLKSLFREVLTEYERERDQIRQRHLDEET